MLAKSSNPTDAISQFAQELAEELRKQPEVKARIDDKEHSSEQEIANKIIINLLTKSYEEIRQINQVIQIPQPVTINQSSQIQKSNTASGLEYLEYYVINDEDDRDIKYHKGYKIYLAKDHDNMWRFEIQREDSSWLSLTNKRRSSGKDIAIGKAKKIIDKDRTTDWETSINNPG